MMLTENNKTDIFDSHYQSIVDTGAIQSQNFKPNHELENNIDSFSDTFFNRVQSEWFRPTRAS